MSIPTLVPPSSGVLSQPYVTPAMVRAYPTWLDLDNLIPGGAAGLQDDALADALLAALQGGLLLAQTLRRAGPLRDSLQFAVAHLETFTTTPAGSR